MSHLLTGRGATYVSSSSLVVVISDVRRLAAVETTLRAPTNYLNPEKQNINKPDHHLPVLAVSFGRLRRGPRGNYPTTKCVPDILDACHRERRSSAHHWVETRTAHGCASVLDRQRREWHPWQHIQGAQPCPAPPWSLPPEISPCTATCLCTAPRCACVAAPEIGPLWSWLLPFPVAPMPPLPHLPPAWRLRFDVQPPPCAK